MSKEWRSASVKTLWRRPIQKHEYGRLVEAMIEDGLDAEITEKGIVFSLKGYEISLSAISKAWGISYNQSKRLKEYIFANGWRVVKAWE